LRVQAHRKHLRLENRAAVRGGVFLVEIERWMPGLLLRGQFPASNHGNKIPSLLPRVPA